MPDYRVAKLVADLIGLLDVLGIQKVLLVAHDWGAAISWQLALSHPERVDRYVALSVGHPTAYARAGLLQNAPWRTLHSDQCNITRGLTVVPLPPYSRRHRDSILAIGLSRIPTSTP